MGCGKRKGRRLLRIWWIDNDALPQAFLLGWERFAAMLLEEIFIFYPFTTLPCISAWQYLHHTYYI
jgi:hypothetical protein